MIFNTKGEGIPKAVNAIVALIVLAGGALPLLTKFGVIGEIPTIPTLVITIITVLAGILLLFDGIVGAGDGYTGMPRGLNFVTALVVLIGGVVPLLAYFKVISALPEIPSVIFSGLLIVAGLVLLLDGLVGAKNTSGM